MKRARGKVKSPSVEDFAPRAPVPDTPPGPGARGARGGLKLNVTTLNVTTGAAPKKKNLPGAWGPAGSVARAPPPGKLYLLHCASRALHRESFALPCYPAP